MATSGWQQWARNGRLATVALAIVFITWLGFQVGLDPVDRPPLLDQILYTMAGAWLGNVTMVQGKKDERERATSRNEGDE